MAEHIKASFFSGGRIKSAGMSVSARCGCDAGIDIRLVFVAQLTERRRKLGDISANSHKGRTKIEVAAVQMFMGCEDAGRLP